MIPVPLFDLKFLVEFAAIAGETSNRRHCQMLAFWCDRNEIANA